MRAPVSERGEWFFPLFFVYLFPELGKRHMGGFTTIIRFRNSEIRIWAVYVPKLGAQLI